MYPATGLGVACVSYRSVLCLQYLGSRAPEPVKKKVLEMMYSWTVGFPEETKISDAYQMLKKQGNQKSRDVISAIIRLFKCLFKQHKTVS